MLPSTKAIVEHFKRYSKFYLKPVTEGADPICWRVEATDTISMPGILEITAVEYYSNTDTDDVDNGIVDRLVVEETPEFVSEIIKGDIDITPKLSYEYQYMGNDNGSWYYDKDLPIEAQINGNKITIKWTKTSYTGQFVLSYGKEDKTIVVEINRRFKLIDAMLYVREGDMLKFNYTRNGIAGTALTQILTSDNFIEVG